MSTLTTRFQDKATMNALHTLAEDVRMQDLFKMLEKEGVILTVQESTEKLSA